MNIYLSLNRDRFKLGLTLNQIFFVLKLALTESSPLFSQLTRWSFNKFKSGMEDLKVIHRKEHPITETTQINIEACYRKRS